MRMNRRGFLSVMFASSMQTATLSVAVLEVFENGTAAVAALVHHANPTARDAFATWLQSHPKFSVRVRTKAGEAGTAKMFRVRMCFGRGLILFEKPMQVRERDVLTIAV